MTTLVLCGSETCMPTIRVSLDRVQDLTILLDLIQRMLQRILRYLVRLQHVVVCLHDLDDSLDNVIDFFV